MSVMEQAVNIISGLRGVEEPNDLIFLGIHPRGLYTSPEAAGNLQLEPFRLLGIYNSRSAAFAAFSSSCAFETFPFSPL